MTPTSFAESNRALGRPRDMTEEQCEPLSVYVGVRSDELPVVISCWKLTPEELEEINRTGRVWLHVIGRSMPPVILQVETPFK